ncbi:hypothetical protein ACHAW5_000148, partial [Stephanodiscus triporus]
SQGTTASTLDSSIHPVLLTIITSGGRICPISAAASAIMMPILAPLPRLVHRGRGSTNGMDDCTNHSRGDRRGRGRSSSSSRLLLSWTMTLTLTTLLTTMCEFDGARAFRSASPPSPPSRHPPGLRRERPLRRGRADHRGVGILSSRSSSSSSSSGGDDDDRRYHDAMPSADEIATQKREAYDALSSFHETSSSLPSASSSSSSRMRSLIRGLLDDDDLGSSTRRAECWSCIDGATSYAVPMDPAAGIGAGWTTRPYRCTVSLEANDNFAAGTMTTTTRRGGERRRKGLRLVETIQSTDDLKSGGPAGVPFVRSIPLGANVDVDPVDGSYSLDDAVPPPHCRRRDDDDDGVDRIASLPLLPPWMSGEGGVDPTTSATFLVEHALAVSETERCRCFLLYGDVVAGDRSTTVPEGGVMEDDYAIIAARRKRKKEEDETERSYRLLSVILTEETKVMPEKERTSAEESNSRIMIESPTRSESSSSSSSSSSSPLDLLKMSREESEDDEKNRLLKSFEGQNTRLSDVGANEDRTTRMERHELGMLGLASGVWLGDAFVREGISPSLSRARALRDNRRTGFGKKKNADAVAKDDDDREDDDGESEEDRFAVWHLGVQKVAMRFEWDYRDSISQSFTYGRALGTPTSLSSMANIKSDGAVVMNESKRVSTKMRRRRRVVWDMDGGAYVAGLVGSSYFRAPRYMSFSQSRSYSADAYLTEFMVFYRPESKDDATSPSLGGGMNGVDLGAYIDEDTPPAAPLMLEVGRCVATRPEQ